MTSRLLDLGTFNIKAANLTDTKSQKLYKQLNPDYNPNTEGEETKKTKGGKKGKKGDKGFDLKEEQKKQPV